MSDKPEMPQAGGSYIRNPDGSLTREEFTIQPGEPGHGEKPPAAEPKAPATPAPTKKGR